MPPYTLALFLTAPYFLRACFSHPTRFFFDFFAHTFNAFASLCAVVNAPVPLTPVVTFGNAIAGDRQQQRSSRLNERIGISRCSERLISPIGSAVYVGSDDPVVVGHAGLQVFEVHRDTLIAIPMIRTLQEVQRNRVP